MQEKIKQIASVLVKSGINSYYVGGCVRDELMGIPSDDIDICLVGVEAIRAVEDVLLRHFESVTPLVGKKFPVWVCKQGDQKVEYAMARKETLTGTTRKDFDVITQGVTIEEDLRRRDFTINSIAKDVLTGQYFDPFDGRIHIQDRVLHPTSDAFGEDTLRVYRAARFLSRFPSFIPSHKLMAACSWLEPTDISNERVGLEFTKMVETALVPSRFFDFLKEVGWLGHHFKEVEDLIGVPQSPKHHPEGDVYVHTMLALDQATNPFIRVCMLCHDLGKATATTIEGLDWNTYNTSNKTNHIDYAIPIPHQLKIKSIGHEMEGKAPTRAMLTRIHWADHKTIRQVECMVELHMIRTGVNEKVVRRTLRKLMEKHLDYEQLVEVCRCDVSSRPPLAGYTPDIGQYRAKELLQSNAMEPIVTGEKLIAAGYIPGKLMGHLVKKGLEWQDRGTLNEDNWEKMIKQYKPKKEEAV